MREETLIIHSLPCDEATGAISTPIYQTSTYVQSAPGVNKGYDYARTNNPTRKTLENLIAVLENGSNGYAFASGLAAVDAVIKLLSAGDEVLAVDDIYGGTFRIYSHIYSKFGIKIHFTDTTDLVNISNVINDKTKFIWIESPTNPTLKISDIAEIAKIAHENGALLVVDNTFASPALQKPLDLGADIVIHSATKYLAGHSDLIAGLVVVKSDDLANQIKFIQNSSGGILSPFDSWLTIRGIETLSLRVFKQCENAFAAAKFLVNRPEIDKIYYPGLESHKNHTIATKQQKAYGAMLSFSFKNDSEETATKFVTSTKLFKLAESLGGVKSLICLPSAMTHKSIPVDARRKSGIQDSLVRLSFGIEYSEDLIQDIEQALNKIN